jgi:phenylacetate-CoA ligase
MERERRADTQPFASVLPAVSWPAVVSPRGMATLSLLYQLERTEWWAPDRLRHHQIDQLRRLTAHAASTVPFYRDRLADLAATTTLTSFWEAWQRLPLLTRTDVQGGGEALVTSALPEGHGEASEVFTSGSTGRPVRVLRSELWQINWSAVTVREHLWHRRQLTGKLAAIRDSAAGVAAYPEGEQFEHWGFSTGEIFATGPCVSLNIKTPLDQQLDWLVGQNPDYLITHPTIVDRLVRLSAQSGRRLDRLKQVLTISETLPAGLRDLCLEVWGVPIVDTYSARDAGYLALQCPDTDNYHLQAETVLVEILDDGGRPCKPGDIGRVVATPLHNFAMPLLRYNLGDYAEVGDTCRCGRGLPTLRRILGRRQNMLRLPTGEERWPLLSSSDIGSLLAFAPIEQYQFVQTRLDHLEIRLQAPRPLTESEERQVVDWVVAKFGREFTVTPICLPELPRSSAGKFEDFISLL